MVTKDSWLDAQVGVLGSVLMEPELAPRMIAETSAEDFSGDCRDVYNAIANIVIRGRPVDAMIVRDKLGAGSAELLKQIMAATLTSANFEAYVTACKEQARLSKLQRLAAELSGAPTLDLARETLQRMQDAVVERNNKRVVDMTAALTGFFEDHQKGIHEYIHLGIEPLDDRLGVDPGDVVVLGGYPSDGKSAMMLQMAYHIAQKRRVGVFSFETSAAKLTDRLVAQAAQVNLGAIKRSDLRPTDWRKVTAVSPAFTGRKLEIIEAAGMTTQDILGLTLSRQYEVIFIDYVQLISTGKSRRDGTRQEELAEISKALAVMARRHKVLTVELSQLNRPASNKDGTIPPPGMSSLRESGQLEQDADVVMLLYRVKQGDQLSPRELYTAKNKEGTLGKCALKFDGKTQTFSRQSDDAAQIARLERIGRRRREGEQDSLPL